MITSLRGPSRLKRASGFIEYALLITVAVVLMVFIATGVIGGGLKDDPETGKTEAVAEESAPAPEKPAEPAEPIDLSILWGILIAAGALSVVSTGGVLAYKVAHKTKEDRLVQKGIKDDLKKRWMASNIRHRDIEKEYGEYLLDLRAIFSRPLLSDVSVPETADFIHAYDLLGESERTPLLTEEAVKSYEVNSSKALTAWRLASGNAARVGLKTFATEDRRKVERAIKLLNMALDPGASDSERTVAYEQVQKLVEGLIVIPKAVLRQIEAGMLKQLTAA